MPTDLQRDTILFSQDAYYTNILEKVVHDKDVIQCLETLQRNLPPQQNHVLENSSYFLHSMKWHFEYPLY